MIINLFEGNRMFELSLPDKAKGQYWVCDTDEKNNDRRLARIEGISDNWYIKSNKDFVLVDGNNQEIVEIKLESNIILQALINDKTRRVSLLVAASDENERLFTKYLVGNNTSLNIGRDATNDIIYANGFVSGKHASIRYLDGAWSVTNLSKSNVTFVNGIGIDSTYLYPGDMIYILGLRIIVGKGFFSINNPNNSVRINSSAIYSYVPQKIIEKNELTEYNQDFFYSSPRFFREIVPIKYDIYAPPQPESIDKVPLALMLGPSITMGMASASVGVITVLNAISTGGKLLTVIPTVIMSISMLVGSILWPILTKKNELKTKRKSEIERQEAYLSYLDSVHAQIDIDMKLQKEILLENVLSADKCMNRIIDRDTSLWDRRPTHSDFLELKLGDGNVDFQAEINSPKTGFAINEDVMKNAMYALAGERKQLTGVPVAISLLSLKKIGIMGDCNFGKRLIDSFIIQIASLYGYNEVKMILIADEKSYSEWSYVRYIPHFWDDERKNRFVVQNENDVKELSNYLSKVIEQRPDDGKTNEADYQPNYVVFCINTTLGKKCEPLQRILGYQNGCGIAMVFLNEEMHNLPKEIDSIIEVNGKTARLFDKNDTSGKYKDVKLEEIDRKKLEKAARIIANVRLGLFDEKYQLPKMLTFMDMLGVGKIEHVNSLLRWKENNPIVSLKAPIGVDTEGNTFYLDLHEKFHGPHGLIAGMTGSGKSEFIMTYILSLAMNYHPEEVSFVLIDYKGGGLAGAFENPDTGVKLPHLVGSITNLEKDKSALRRALVSLNSEKDRRQKLFNQAKQITNDGTMDIYQYQKLYRNGVIKEPISHLFIISDEFAELKAQQPDFMDQLISIARVGRSLGIHLILATQRPSGVVNDQIWSNSRFRVCLKVQDSSDSNEMIKRPEAAEIVQTGRFYLQVGYNELFSLGQSAWCGAPYIPTDTVVAEIDDTVDSLDNFGHVVLSERSLVRNKANESDIKQIVACVKYLSDLANDERICVRNIWMEPIPEMIFVDDIYAEHAVVEQGFVLNPVIGLYDDLENQQRVALRLPISAEGNCLIYGAPGSGKDMLLESLLYSLIMKHDATELNAYVLDFGSEALKAFAKAPQVGSVILSEDEDKVKYLFRFLNDELSRRKNVLSEYGGDFTSFVSKSDKKLPNIVIVINNIDIFSELYENVYDDFVFLAREGSRAGIYFVITASSLNSVRVKVEQNFKFKFTLRLNDEDDYGILFSRTERIYPAACDGRGLVKFDKVYEFQTAHCVDDENEIEAIRNICMRISDEYTGERAKIINILPEIVDADTFENMDFTVRNIPVGVNEKSFEPVVINLEENPGMVVSARDITSTVSFTIEISKLVSRIGKTFIMDPTGLMDSFDIESIKEYIADDVEECVLDMNAEAKKRWDDVSANNDESLFDNYETRFYIFLGFEEVMKKLSEHGQDKLTRYFKKATAKYHMHAIFIEDINYAYKLKGKEWYAKWVAENSGIWLGNGLSTQNVYDIDKILSIHRKEVPEGFGYFVKNLKPVLTKCLGAKGQEVDD